jgi:hypothetical protein
LREAGNNRLSVDVLSAASPSKLPVVSPQEIKKQFSDKVLSLLNPEECDEMSKPVAYEETRCGVCGLNERETDILNQDTGELLGGYFTCDGNCGNSFHVRCAGEVGDGGQYVVPSGEWFCTTCSVADDATSDVIMSAGPVSSGVGGAAVKAEGGEGGGMSAEQKDQQIARLQAEYHAMRRERNRVLNQWQHEKRLASKSCEYRDQREKDLDAEIVAARDVIGKLQDDVLKGYIEQNRLKKLLEDMVEAQKQTQKVLDGDFQPVLDRSRTRGGRRNRYCVEAADDSPTQDDRMEAPMEEKSKESAQGLMSKQYSSVSTESIVSGAMMARYASQSGVLASPAANPADEIPKPWLKKSSSRKEERASSRDDDRDGKDAASAQMASPLAPTRLSTSPIRRTKSGRHLNKGISGGSSGASSGVYEEVQPLTIEALGAGEEGIDSTASTTPAGRRSPFNNRLKNLLKSVKEETGSFVEIRKKYKERETERMMLKSRHHRGAGRGAENNKVVSLSSSLPAIL